MEATGSQNWTIMKETILEGTNFFPLEMIKQKTHARVFSHVQLFVTVAHQALVSMGFSRQEYWSGLPFPSPEIFPTQGWNPHLLPCREILFLGNPEQFLGANNSHLFPFVSMSIFSLQQESIHFLFSLSSWSEGSLKFFPTSFWSLA